MRLLFFGTAAFAIPSLEQLVTDGHHVVVCVTQPERPQGRGLSPQPSPVKTAALRLHLAVEEPEELACEQVRWRRLAPDLGVVISYGRLIPRSFLDLPPTHGMLGVHPSLLPKYRGASPITWAMLNGEQTSGVTVFRLNERLDAGDILLQRAVPIEPQEDAAALSARLARLGADLLVEGIRALEEGTARFTPQEEQLATYAPKLTKAQGKIDWQQDAASIARLIRAVVPWPGAYTTWRGQLLKLWVASAREPARAGARPGEMVSMSTDGIAIATGKGTLVVHELQPAGRRRMRAQEWLAGHDAKVGDVFGMEAAIDA